MNKERTMKLSKIIIYMKIVHISNKKVLDFIKML